MARIRLVDLIHAEPPLRGVLEGIQRRLGTLPNMYKALANHPGVFDMTISMLKTVQAGPLDPKIRELAYLMASATNGCEYCLSLHLKSGLAAGLNQAQLGELTKFEQSAAYDDRQKLVLRFARDLTAHANARADLVDVLRRVFSDAELVHLAAVVGTANWTNRFIHAFDIELEH